MEAIKQYIAANPDKYSSLIADVDAKVTGLTDAQKQDLAALAPQSLVDSTASATASKSAPSNEELD